jgi:phage FluMu gp28-like protein
MSKEYATPYALLTYQQRWVGDKATVKVCEKSRRVGISWSEAADAALYAAAESGDNVWYIGYNKDMAEEFIADCAFWARQYNLAADAAEEVVIDDEGKDILAFRINFASGHKIVALSSRPKNLRGKQGRIIIDEAAFHDDLKQLLKAAIALLMWGGEVRIISTHDGEENPFNELVNDIRSGKKPYSLHRITFDDALAQGLYKRICLKLGREWSPAAEDAWRQEMIDSYGDDADEELFCVPAKGSGTPLTRALVETCLEDGIPVLRYAQTDEFTLRDDNYRQSVVQDWIDEHLAPLFAGLDPKRFSWFGEDFARSGDLTVLLPLQEQQDTRRRSPFIVELRNMPFRQQEQIVFYILDRLPRFQHGAFDARGNGQYLAEVAMQRYGANRISQVMLSDAWYLENMPKYKTAFEDRSIVLPKDADLIEDHRALRKIKGVIKLPEIRTAEAGTKKKRHGDTAIAGALAWFATYQEAAVDMEFQSTGKGRIGTQFDGYMQ